MNRKVLIGLVALFVLALVGLRVGKDLGVGGRVAPVAGARVQISLSPELVEAAADPEPQRTAAAHRPKETDAERRARIGGPWGEGISARESRLKAGQHTGNRPLGAGNP